MKKLLIFTFLAIFLFGSTALAIEKKDTKRITQKEADKQVLQKSKQDTQSGNLKSGNNKRQAIPRDYNDFIDRNNNGIDDRIESRKKKARAEKKQIDQNVKKKKVEPNPKEIRRR